MGDQENFDISMIDGKAGYFGSGLSCGVQSELQVDDFILDRDIKFF